MINFLAKNILKHPLFRFFSSLELAVVLILTLAFVLAVGTGLESVYGMRAVRAYVYGVHKKLRPRVTLNQGLDGCHAVVCGCVVHDDQFLRWRCLLENRAKTAREITCIVQIRNNDCNAWFLHHNTTFCSGLLIRRSKKRTLTVPTSLAAYYVFA